MSIPGWNPPQRGPNGLVIGPLTGQIRPELAAGAGADEDAADVVAGASDDVEAGAEEDAVGCAAARAASAARSAARILASISALAAAVAFDSSMADCSCARATIRAMDLPARDLESVCRLVSSSLWMIATCWSRASIRFVSFETRCRTCKVCARARTTRCFARATCCSIDC